MFYQKFILTIWFLITMLEPASAALSIVEGNNQRLTAGTPSADIVFRVADAVGNPVTGATVNFTLFTPTGVPSNSNLSKIADNSNEIGRVATRLNALNTAGNYIVNAKLAQDAAQAATANIIVVADRATQIVLVAGGYQKINTAINSANIRFKVTDRFSNAVAGEPIQFTLVMPNGTSVHSGLTPLNAITDGLGEFNLYFNATSIPGIYTIIVQSANNPNIATTTSIQVNIPIPELPSLGFGGIVDPTGKIQDNLSLFNGGISVKNAVFEQEVVHRTTDSVLIKGIIRPESFHVGQTVDIVVAAGYIPMGWSASAERFYTLDRGVPQLWDGYLHTLAALTNEVTLLPVQEINIYNETLPGGILRIWFGYRLSNGAVIFNANQTLNAQVSP